METIFNIFYLSCFALIIVQVILLVLYFKPLIISVLNGNIKNFDKSKDIAVLLMFLIAILFSIYGFSNWKGIPLDLLTVTMVVLFTNVCIFMVKKVKKENDFQRKNSSPFHPVKREKVEELLFYLKSNDIFSSETSLLSFEQLIAGYRLEEPIVYIGKYKGNLTYSYLILLLKVLMKKENFEFQKVFKIIKDNFIFQAKDSKTNETIFQDGKNRPIEQSFTKINSSTLVDYQEDFYEKIINICKSDMS